MTNRITTHFVRTVHRSSTFEESCGCTALDMLDISKEITEQTDWRTKQPRLGRSEVLRSLRHNLRAQSQGYHTIDSLEKRGIVRGSAQRSSLRGRERTIVNQTNVGTVSKATCTPGKHMAFPEHIDTVLN